MYNNSNDNLCIIKMKFYFGTLALMWLLSGCKSQISPTVDNPLKQECYIYMLIDNHLYGVYGSGFSHMGTCKQCKHELDSIVKNAVNEALEASMKEDWNE